MLEGKWRRGFVHPFFCSMFFPFSLLNLTASPPLSSMKRKIDWYDVWFYVIVVCVSGFALLGLVSLILELM